MLEDDEKGMEVVKKLLQSTASSFPSFGNQNKSAPGIYEEVVSDISSSFSEDVREGICEFGELPLETQLKR